MRRPEGLDLAYVAPQLARDAIRVNVKDDKCAIDLSRVIMLSSVMILSEAYASRG